MSFWDLHGFTRMPEFRISTFPCICLESLFTVDNCLGSSGELEQSKHPDVRVLSNNSLKHIEVDAAGENLEIRPLVEMSSHGKPRD